MFQVIYLCNYRPHWYTELEPTDDWNLACLTCDAIARQRGGLARVANPYTGQTLFESDYRR